MLLMVKSIAKILRILNIEEKSFLELNSFSEVPGWDSIMQMQLVIVLESELGVELTAEAIQALTPEQLVQLYEI